MNETTQKPRASATGRLPLGRCYITQGAREALQEAGELPQRFLRRHQRGDWGELTGEDSHANEMALRHGGRLLSSYRTARGAKLWIITEADRKITTILLPDEY